ncbi:MAG: methyltransferase domain-containing protein [Chloroflexia bacterium]
MEDWSDPKLAKKWNADNTSHNPTRLEQLDILLSVLADEYTPGTAILDIGMGAGHVEEMLFERIPGAFVVGTDFSEPMLDIARARLSPYADSYEIVRQDLTNAWEAQLPAYKYSVVFSVQVIHNVAHPHKREAFAFIHHALMPGGLFLLLDRIRVGTPGLFNAYGSVWDRLDRMSGARHREGNTFEEHERSVSTRGDRPATLEEHLAWLREAGFAEVACLHLHGNRALIAARK